MAQIDSANNYINNLLNGVISNINSCLIARIERFDGRKMKADLVPLIKNSDNEEVSMLIEVPVAMVKAGGFVIRPPYKRGDIVVVVFADRDIDNVLLSGKVSNLNSTRKHSLDDAIVIGSISPFTENLPSTHSNDLIIAKEDLSSKIVLKQDGGIEIKSNKSITISGPNQSQTWN